MRDLEERYGDKESLGEVITIRRSEKDVNRRERWFVSVIPSKVGTTGVDRKGYVEPFYDVPGERVLRVRSDDPCQ